MRRLGIKAFLIIVGLCFLFGLGNTNEGNGSSVSGNPTNVRGGSVLLPNDETPIVTDVPIQTETPGVTASPGNPWEPGPPGETAIPGEPNDPVTPTAAPQVTKPPRDTVTYVAAPKITYRKRQTLTSVKIKWSKVEKASSYEVYMSTKPKSGFKKIKTTKSTSYVKHKLSKNKKYYFKVRAYNNQGKRVYGKFSETVTVEVLSIQKIKNKILSQKKKFPDGKYWNHVSKKVSVNKDTSLYVTNKPCYHFGISISSTCNRYYCKASNTIGYQCWGYVDKISDIVFGVNSKIKSHKSFTRVKIGDHIRYQGHSVLVIDKGNNYVKVTEVNYGNTCRIRWGRKIYKSELKGAVYYTRY